MDAPRFYGPEPGTGYFDIGIEPEDLDTTVQWLGKDPLPYGRMFEHLSDLAM